MSSRMKPMILILVALVVLLSLPACGRDDASQGSPQSSPTAGTAPQDGSATQTPAATPAGKTVEEMLEQMNPAAPTPTGEQTVAETPEPVSSSAPAAAEPATPAGKTVEEMLEQKDTGAPAAMEVGGVAYTKNPSVTSYLFIGVDKAGTVSREDYYGGQCDLIHLLVIDSAAKTYTTIQLDRDTMAQVDILDFEGDLTGISATQSLAFAHSYGNGTEKSCENVVRAVSRFLGGIKISGYAAVQYEAVPSVHDTLGGISVTIEDDFSEYDPMMTAGNTVELTGEQALVFVRWRKNIGDGVNTSRLRRQRVYLAAFAERLREEMHGNSAIINDLYNTAQPYMVTDLSVGTAATVAAKALDYSDCGIVTPKGEVQYVTYENGRTYAEFYADQDALEQLILDLFYVQAN